MIHIPIVRWGIGLSGAIAVAAVAYFFLSGTAQLVAYGIAAMDLVVTPLVLKQAAEG